MKKCSAFIFARGGSQGLKNKNLLKINGKSLVQIAIECAKGAKHIGSVSVSTDNLEIASEAAKCGAVVIHRPGSLSLGLAGMEWLSWRHAIKESAPMDVFVSVPCTAPLRRSEDIDNTIEKLLSSHDCSMAVTVSKAKLNPYHTGIVIGDNGIEPLLKMPVSSRRQDMPPVWNIVGAVYAARPEFVLRASSMWECKIAPVEIPNERAVDIDDAFDFEIAKLLMENSNGSHISAANTVCG